MRDSGLRQLGALLLLTLLLPTAQPQEPWEGGSGQLAEEINILEYLTLHAAVLANVSLTSEDSCLSLDMGQYSTLSISTRAAFGDSFADELSVLIKLRSTLQDDTGLITILSLQGEILFQIRISPKALIFLSSRRGHYEFPVSSLTDGHWHHVGLAVSSKGVALYVDCKLQEMLPWSNFFGLGVRTDGILMLGGLIEPYEVPFKGSVQQLLFVMGDSGAARDYCQNHNRSCLSSFSAEHFLNLSRNDHGRRSAPDHKLAAVSRTGEKNVSTRSPVQEVSHSGDKAPGTTRNSRPEGQTHNKLSVCWLE